MKKLVVLLVIVSFIGVAGAALTTVATTGSKDGTVYEDGSGYGVWGVTLTNAYVGDDLPNGEEYCMAVVKFELPSLSSGDAVTDALLTAGFNHFQHQGGTLYYIKVRHYTYDNSSDVSASDYDDAHLENGQVVTFAATTGNIYGEYDVTDFVKSDVANGNTYSSFAFQMVKSDGTPFVPADNLFDFCWMTTAEGAWSDYSTPHLDITTIPEPATLALLMLGGMLVGKKK